MRRYAFSMNKNSKSLVINLIKSFLVASAWMNIGGLESSSIMLICVAAASFILLQYKPVIVGASVSKCIRISSYVLGGLFSVLYLLFRDMTGGLENPLFVAVYVICSVAGIFVMFSELLQLAFVKAEKVSVNGKGNAFSLKLMLIYAGIVFVCCLPFLALNYPGVMTPDSLSQYGQIIGSEPKVNHHPWFHTLIIGVFYKLGFAITGNTYTAIAFYTVFQILAVSISIGYSIECMYELGLGRKLRIALLLCFVLLPYNLIYAVTVWKDILFSMAVLVLSITIFRMWNKVCKRDMILFIICGICMCLLRHNGFYAFIATAVFLLIAKRRQIRPYLISCVGIILVAVLMRGPVPDAAGYARDEFLYNVPIPLVQIGDIVANDCELTPSEEEFLRSINSLEYMKAAFSPQGADGMSAWVLAGDTEFFNSHKGEFFKLWLKLGMRYPARYFRSFLNITMGYWAPMQPQQTVFFGITEYGTGLHTQPLFDGPVLIKINELLFKLYTMIPLYGFMYCMGGFFWVLLILGALSIIRKQYGKIVCMLPVFFLTCTLFIATPLVADLRYSYALMITLPYLLFLVISGSAD